MAMNDHLDSEGGTDPKTQSKALSFALVSVE